MKRASSLTGKMVALVLTVQVAHADDGGAAPADAPQPPALLSTLLQWLPGDYTNAAALRLPRIHGEAGDSDRLTTYIRRVELPMFGTDVLFLEEYRGAEESAQERVRLYVFETSTDAVRLRLLNPKDPEALRGARHDLRRVRALTPADVTVDRTVCTLAFARLTSGVIVGRMKSHACDVKASWVDYELHVGPNGHWVCYSRRAKHDDAVAWQLIPPLPCVLMSRVD